MNVSTNKKTRSTKNQPEAKTNNVGWVSKFRGGRVGQFSSIPTLEMQYLEKKLSTNEGIKSATKHSRSTI